MNIQQILNERGKTHGDFSENAFISQELKAIVRQGTQYYQMTPVQKEAIDMILHKISRAVSGNNNEPDHYRDIAGYAQLVVDRLTTP